jgi:hypothetical protein
LFKIYKQVAKETDMLKYVLLATSVAIASPAFAQDAPAAETTVPAPAQDAAGTPQTAPAPAEATAAAQPAPAEPAPAQPASSESQVAQVVNTEFANYDADKDGALNKAEFDTWMNTLRKAAEPGYVAESPAGKTWLTQAFTQADTDKNAKINAVELTAFLTPKTAS